MKKIEITSLDVATLRKLSSGNSIYKRALKIFQALLLDFEFKPFVYSLRKKLKIPHDGYNIKKDWKLFKDTYLTSNYGMVFFEESHGREQVEEFMEKNYLQRMISELGLFGETFTRVIIEEYVLFDRLALQGLSVGLVDTTNYESEEMPDEIMIYFLATATKDEMVNFIEEKWDRIKELKQRITDKDSLNKRNKPSKNFARDIIIFNRYQGIKDTPTKDRENRYIDIEISEFLENQLKIDLSEGSIRAIIDRMTKLVKEINK